MSLYRQRSVSALFCLIRLMDISHLLFLPLLLLIIISLPLLPLILSSS